MMLDRLYKNLQSLSSALKTFTGSSSNQTKCNNVESFSNLRTRQEYLGNLRRRELINQKIDSQMIQNLPIYERCSSNFINSLKSPSIFSISPPYVTSILSSVFSPLKLHLRSITLEAMHRRGPHIKVRPKRQPLDGRPFMKGIVLKTLIKKPKKPNSANRKCVLVRLANGDEKVAYVPGIGHNLQEHNIVLVRCGRLQDVPGVKIKCVRGVYDLPHVIKQKSP